MTTPAQIRAARSMIGYSQKELAEKSDVSISTLKRAEGTIGPPASAQATAAIRSVLEAAGVEFIAENGGGPGVRLQK